MAHDTAPSLRFAVLGPVRAWRGDQPVNAGSPQQRAVLAALLLRGGRTATAPELLDAVWGEEPPDRAMASLRTYAFRLRKVLGTDALVSESGGYALRVAPGGLDLTQCELWVAEADKSRAAGEPERARGLLRRALELWEGEPLAGVPGPYADAQRSRLAEWRLALLENRLELDLDLGGHTEVVSELTALSAEHPLRERLRVLLMLALYRGGRQAEALGVYADTRRLLSDELGVDPGPELAEMHQRILQADPGLAAPTVIVGSGAAGADEPAPVRPAQLPAAVADFTGRASFVHELGEKLACADGRVVALSAVSGIGGVGKTTLAVHVAHAACERFPDGQLYVDLQGAGPRPAEPEAVLAALLRALGTPDSAIPEGLEERAGLYRSALAGRRVLALLDNARDATQVRPLLPGSPGCAVLVTSRARMVDLPGAHLVDLDVMGPEEALTLFTRIVGEARVSGERAAALEVVAACGYLPLAIRIAASRLVTRRTWTVSVLVKKLADERRRLDELRLGELAVGATFELGYGQLEPGQARAFRLLALPDGPDISLDAAAAALDLDAYQAEDVLESLVDASLLEAAAPGRYRYHDLLRLYARRRAERDEPAAEREAALSRLLDFYLATASHAYALENPGDRLLDHLVATSRPGLAFTETGGGLDWLFREASCLLAAVQQVAGADTGRLRRAADLLLLVQDLMESGGYSRQYEQATRVVIEAARERGDARSGGRARVILGQVHQLAGRFDEAGAESGCALDLGRAASDPVTCAYAPNLRGIVAMAQNRNQDAGEYFTQALECFKADGNRLGEAVVRSNLSRVHLNLGQAQDAVTVAEEGLALHQELGVTLRLGTGLYALGLALAGAGRMDEALSRQGEALIVFRDCRQRWWEGMTLFRMAENLLAADRAGEAAINAEHALGLLRDIGGDWRSANALAVLGRALDLIGHADRARACWQQALELYERLRAPEADEVRALLAGPTAQSAAG